MPNKTCCICKRLQLIPKDQWSLVSYVGDFVCSKDCVLAWLNCHYLDQKYPEALDKMVLERAVSLWENRADQPVFRSEYERNFAGFLTQNEVWWDYERYGFFVGDKKTYMPDFFLPQFGVFIETKGKWGPGQKKKMAMFRNQYPEVPLLVISWVIHEEFYDE